MEVSGVTRGTYRFGGRPVLGREPLLKIISGLGRIVNSPAQSESTFDLLVFLFWSVCTHGPKKVSHLFLGPLGKSETLRCQFAASFPCVNVKHM